MQTCAKLERRERWVVYTAALSDGSAKSVWVWRSRSSYSWTWAGLFFLRPFHLMINIFFNVQPSGVLINYFVTHRNHFVSFLLTPLRGRQL